METDRVLEWRPVIGYEGLYEVSNDGDVRSLLSDIKLKLYKDRCGYIYVSLYKNKKSRKHKVHRIVASSFIRQPIGREQVNHIDGIKFNNRVSNLEWLTAGDNQRHAFRIGLKKGLIGRDNPSWIGNVQQSTISGEKIKVWNSLREIMRETGYDKSAISRHIRGDKNYSHAYGYKWHFIK